MIHLAIAIAIFAAGYCLTLAYTSIFYHRGLTHQALVMKPWLRRFVVATGSWVTSLDPKGWSCMHRMHHAHSDTPDDPHSPLHQGFFGVLRGQLRSYERTLVGLVNENERYTRYVPDLDFPVGWLQRRRLWFLPALLHLFIGAAVAWLSGVWFFGAAYWLGMIGHPFQGFLVNSFGHRFGGRNFATPDNSRNNLVIAWLVAGEGLQNNHHRYATSARFSYRWYEVDTGYLWVLVLEKFGWLRVNRESLIPESRPARKSSSRAVPSSTSPQGT